MGIFSRDSIRIKDGVCTAIFEKSGCLNAERAKKLFNDSKCSFANGVFIEIGDKVSYVDNEAFYCVRNIIGFFAQEGQENVRVIDGSLYSKDGKRLIKYASGKKEKRFFVPNGITEIETEAFSNSDNLTSIILPDSVTNIGIEAFGGCRNLKSVVLGNNVTRIGLHAFNKSHKVTIYTPFYMKHPIWDNEWNPQNRPVAWWTSVLFQPPTDAAVDNPVYIYDGYCTMHFNKGELTKERVDLILALEQVKECKSISVKVGGDVTQIGDFAFAGCEGLTSLQIDEGVNKIGKNAFDNCKALAEVLISDTVTKIDEYAFCGCVSLKKLTLPTGVSKIGNNAFSTCIALESIELPDDLGKIEDGLFYDCKSLTGVKLPREARHIGEYAFCGCKSIEKLTLPKAIERIEDKAFQDCKALKEMYIPEEVTYVGMDAFAGCEGLKIKVEAKEKPDTWHTNWNRCNNEVAWGASNKAKSLNNDSDGQKFKVTEENGDYTVCIFGEGELTSEMVDAAFTSKMENESNSVTVKIGEGITSIGEDAFAFRKSVTNVQLSNSIEAIGENAFFATDIKSMVIPKGVVEIGENAFSNCDKMEELVLFDGLESIGDFAFSGCVSLKKIEIPKSVIQINDTAFSNCIGVLCFKVDPENSKYAAIGGNLYTKDGRKLINYAMGRYNKVFKVPKDVEEIGPSAFTYCTNLARVIIPKSVKTVGAQSFAYGGRFTVCCEAKRAPKGWHMYWASCCTVIWDWSED